MSEEWGTATDEPVVAAEQFAVVTTPEIKLFGKWSTDDVQVSDISLTVSLRSNFPVLSHFILLMFISVILALVKLAHLCSF